MSHVFSLSGILLTCNDSRYNMVCFPKDRARHLLSTRDRWGPPRNSRTEASPMSTKTHSKVPLPTTSSHAKTLADVLAVVERSTTLSPTRLRDLRSAVIRVAD